MTTLITGISGQDGTLLKNKLSSKNEKIIGITSNIKNVSNQDSKIENIDFYSVENLKTKKIIKLIETHKVDRIFNFASYATGIGMYANPKEILKINGLIPIKFLEALKIMDNTECSFIQASSSEMFGDVDSYPQNEKTPLKPNSPYGVAKALAHNYVSIYRKHFNLNVSSAILFNHESSLRNENFVTAKIAKTAVLIKQKKEKVLKLGDIQSKRDWGCASEFVDAMISMSESKYPDDYVVSTGKLFSVEDLCRWSFEELGMDYKDFIVSDIKSDERLHYSSARVGDSSKIKLNLGWTAKKTAKEVIKEMTKNEYKKNKFNIHKL